jgi:hypothetical protein
LIRDIIHQNAYWGVTMSATAQTPEVPVAVAVPGATTVAVFQAVGAQIYEGKAGSDGKLAWSFREPVATLIQNGKTVGCHFAGPTWQAADGSAITAKASGNAPGATPNDIPLLKLDVQSHKGSGILSKVSVVQRLDTKGGVPEAACTTAGEFCSVPYTATYVFLSTDK